MSNVRRRLTLYYGDTSDLEISSADGVTTVRFLLPLHQAALAQAGSGAL
jgi:sensor histidine kinase YesM